LLGIGLHARLDFFLQAACHAVHPHDHGDHQRARDQHQQPFEPVFAHAPALQQNCRDKTGARRQNDACPGVARQGAPPGAIQVHQHDADDEGGFDTFAECDKKRG
jgi:hypothetical protein